MTRDLFTSDSEGWLSDTVLLDRLVQGRRDEIVAGLRAEGFKWVEFAPSITWEQQEKLSYLRADHAESSAEAQAQVDALQAEYDRLVADCGEEPEDEKVYDRMVEITAQADDLSQGDEVWTDEKKAVSGILVTVDQNGEASIRRGVVKPEDKAAAKRLNGAGQGAQADDQHRDSRMATQRALSRSGGRSDQPQDNLPRN